MKRCPHCGAILEPEDDFLEQTPKSNRERIRDVLIDVLADGHIPESDFLIRPFENGIDALVLEFRKLESKSRLDGDLTSKIIAAIHAAYEEELNWQFNNTTSPTRPVIACIVAEHRRSKARATARHAMSEHAERSQAALRERKAVVVEEQDVWWERILGELALQMTTPTFDAWLKDTKVLEWGEEQIVIGVKNEYAKDWLENRMLSIIKRVVAADGVTSVAFEVMT